MSEFDGAAERSFFREEFRQSTVVIALRGGPVAAAVPVIRELVEGDARVIVVVGSTPESAVGDDGRPVDVTDALSVAPVAAPESRSDLAQLWTRLEDIGLQIVVVNGDAAPAATKIATELGVSKLVLTDAAGGWGGSFASFDDLDAVDRRRTGFAAAIRDALQAGVDGVNVCRIEDLDTELFTFDGAGTLFTANPYVRVVRLGADDLPVVEQLVARGVAEGFLRPRERTEVVRLALGGLGARVGPRGHLAGFGALETELYEPTGVGEVTCLYTVNRYEGEGVGGRLVEGLLDDARRRGLGAVFACTVSDRAAGLFERSGFRGVEVERLPEAKWVGYDPDRRNRVDAHWIDLDDSSSRTDMEVPA